MAFQGDSIYWVEVEKIVPNPFQPRREFDPQKLQELADSVRMYGILQPLTVTRKEVAREDGTFYTEYELIAGERRLRASKLAGLSQVPVIIREGDDSEQEKLELAIIENLQREDLNAVDRALAFRQLADVFGLAHSQVARKVGRSREYVSNSIRLLGLPDYMLTALRQAEMSEGHARTLLMLNDRPEEQDVVFREILLKKLSVREVERIVRKIATDKVRKKNPMEFDNELIEMEKQFMETLGTRVQIQKTDYGGRLTIDYFSVTDLEGMLSRMKVETVPANEADRQKLVEHTALAAIGAVTAAETVIEKVDRAMMEESDAELLAERPVAVPESLPLPLSTAMSAVAPAPMAYVPAPLPVATMTSIAESAVAGYRDESVNPTPALESEPMHQSLVQPVAEEYVSPTLPPVSAEALRPPAEVELSQYPNHYYQPAPQPTAPVAAQLSTVTPEVSEKVSEPAPDSDDSDLYSIRNFGI